MSTISRTMNKSMDRSITDSSHVITEKDINSEVIVAGSHHGVLKFVGTVNKKEGLFCGVELEEPFGKHDGTFEGIQYFVGKANHCIFAPLYKVLLTKSENPLETTDIRDMSYKKINRPNSLLSRSAIPNLATSGYYKPRYSKEYNHKLMNNSRSDDFPNDLMDISTDSIMSNSKIFNNTDITNSDYMANSFSTYTISRKPKTNFGGLDDSQISNNRYNSLNLMETSTDFYPHNGTSLVSTARTEDVNFNYGSGELNYTTDTEEDMSASRILDHPTLDPNLLPTVYGKRQMVNYMIIQGNQTTYDSFDDDSETPPDIETPHADNVNRAICQTFVEDSDEEIDLERTRRICEEEQDDEDGFNLCSESSRESSFGGTNTIRSTEDVRGNIQSCTTSNGDISKSVDGKNDNGSTTPKMTTSRPSIEQLKNASARLLKATLQNNPPVESKSAEARRLKAEKAAAEAKAKGKSTSNVATTTRVQKKDRVSVLESAKASDVPKIIRPPKPKSKHQILMDQIKASLEAEKNRPKKVVTSTIKVQLSENKTGSCKGSTEDMNKPVNVASKNTAPISKRVPLRTTTDVNGKSVPPNNVKKLPISKKIEATASARATKVEKPVNAVIPTRTTMSSRINRPTSSFAPAIAHSRKGSQASGVLSTTSTLSRKLDLNKAKQGDHAKTVISADKEMMLKQNADAALVMAIALNNINCQLAAANARHAREISIKKQWQDNWETKISNLNDELIKEMK